MKNSEDKHTSNCHRKCFVIMPYSVKKETSRYSTDDHWSKVYECLIKPAVTSAGFECVRDDYDAASRIIVIEILAKIEAADIILCDLSSLNANVFLELGWALKADKPFVLIKDEMTDYTFDLNMLSIMNYSSRLAEGLEEEIKKLKTVIKETDNDPNRRYSITKLLRAISSFSLNHLNASAGSPKNENENPDKNPKGADKPIPSEQLKKLKKSGYVQQLKANYFFDFDQIKDALVNTDTSLDFINRLIENTRLGTNEVNKLRNDFLGVPGFDDWFNKSRRMLDT